MGKLTDFPFHSGIDIRRVATLAACALSLCGCMSNPIPNGYTGPVARISDSYTPTNNKGLNFFYLAKVNGKNIDNSPARTAQANAGMGFSMNPVIIGRYVPARSAVFTIIGRTYYGAPILDLANTVYEVSGNIRFTPQADHSYKVKGILSDTGSSVWIEDQNGTVIVKKFESRDSALDLFEK